jgi:DeoR/GlpR family transcriptional regulator of sugar metabolism
VSDRQGFILLLIKDNDLITIQEISQKIKVSEKNVKRELAVLQEKGILTREGFELEDASLASILASFSSSGDL